MIRYGIPIYSQVNDAQAAVDAILESSIIPDEIVIIDNSEKNLVVSQFLIPITDKTKFTFINRTKNILSGAWNDFMQRGHDNDIMIIANDDVKPHKHSIEALITAAFDNPEVAMLNGSGHSGNSYSFFLLHPWAYKIVGPFDEGFIPAYYEDNDYDWRLRHIHKLIRLEVSNATFDHVGSATFKAMTAQQQQNHHIRMVRNKQRYLAKWGGLPEHERYYTEFAGIDLSDL